MSPLALRIPVTVTVSSAADAEIGQTTESRNTSARYLIAHSPSSTRSADGRSSVSPCLWPCWGAGRVRAVGLSRPLPALSPRYIAAALDAALDRLQRLGSYGF